jgi:hypothetical protein
MPRKGGANGCHHSSDQPRPRMIEAVIRRPAEDVFDFCSDLRSELQWNPKAKYVEKLK